MKSKSAGQRIIFGLWAILVGLLLGLAKMFSWAVKRTARYVRQKPGSAAVIALLLALLVAVLATGARVYDQSLESQIEAEVVEAIDRHATFKRDFDRERASRTGREFMRTGAPTWLRHKGIRAIIVESRAAGLDNTETAVMIAIADRESGFNPLAKAKRTTACGLFQFIAETGRRFGLPPSECMNPRPNTRAQVRHFRHILEKIDNKLVGLSGEERLVMMFKQVYCRHHDGVNASSCSNIASATVTNGLDLLFAAYEELEEADSRQSRNPGFAGEVAKVLQKAFVTMRDWVAPVTARFTSMVPALSPLSREH